MQLPNAKLNALEINKKQWGIGAEGGAVSVPIPRVFTDISVTHLPYITFAPCPILSVKHTNTTAF